MADTKISALTSLAGSAVAPADDVLPIVDTSVTTTKKITMQGVYDATNTLTTLASASLSAGADFIPIYSAGDSATKKILASNLRSMSPITNSLGADVNLSNTGSYFDGPSIAQGTAGTWFASGTVTVFDTTGNAVFSVKLWDGTTVIASAYVRMAASGGGYDCISLSGYLASPAGNIRISVKDETSTGGKILYNQSGNSKDSTVSAIRIA